MANIKKCPAIDIESVFDKDRTTCSVEVKFNSNFNYRFINSSFPKEFSHTTTSISISIDECESIQDLKAALLQEVTSICDSWIIKSVMNESYSIDEWKNIQNEFLKKVINYINSDEYKISNIVFVDKEHGLTFSVDCHIYFVKQVSFI